MKRADAYLLVRDLRRMAEVVESRLSDGGYRELAKHVYGARLRLSEALDSLGPVPQSGEEPKR